MFDSLALTGPTDFSPPPPPPPGYFIDVIAVVFNK